MTLADDVVVYPAHGAGSACGKNIGKETFSTIGEQKQNNYALQPMSKETFIATVTEGIQPAPAYFFKDAKLNKQGYTPIEEVINKGMTALDVNTFEQYIKEGITIIDTRIPDVFEQGFIPGALNFGLNGQYAIWAATLLDITQPLLIVSDEGKERESIERLTRVGFENIKGYLKGSYEAWKNAGKRFDMVISIDDEEFALDVKNTEVKVLDVRKPGEFADLHMKTALHFPLDTLNKDYTTLDKNEEYLIHCAGGYRSMVAASFLKSKGFMLVKNVYGGFGKIRNLNLEFESGNQTA